VNRLKLSTLLLALALSGCSSGDSDEPSSDGKDTPGNTPKPTSDASMSATTEEASESSTGGVPSGIDSATSCETFTDRVSDYLGTTPDFISGQFSGDHLDSCLLSTPTDDGAWGVYVAWQSDPRPQDEVAMIEEYATQNTGCSVTEVPGLESVTSLMLMCSGNDQPFGAELRMRAEIAGGIFNCHVVASSAHGIGESTEVVDVCLDALSLAAE
jgi:hypothetical protein